MQKHLQLEIIGFVQGVGFRPFVARLAHQFQQTGWVCNTQSGVQLSIQGEEQKQTDFIATLQNQLPPFSEILQLTIKELPLEHFSDFKIQTSQENGNTSLFVLPDLATCSHCLEDLFNPNSRYFHYPFVSCCECGVRYSVMEKPLYDRKHTTMADFELCKKCQHEYDDITNRRFHAQTIGCFDCGAQLNFLNNQGEIETSKHLEPLHFAIEKLKQGKIIAIKGIGGFQFAVDANNLHAIETLRKRKHRPQKPFALMVADLKMARSLCELSELETRALTSPAAPIVLLKKKKFAIISENVAPECDLLGVMLPCSPLHHLLLHFFNAPLIMTSANLNGEPICIENQHALEKLQTIADYFLTHNRRILHALDDSIVRLIAGKITVLRRGRGYSSIPITLNKTLLSQLAVGGQLKNSIAFSYQNQVVFSSYLGDLNNFATQKHFEKTIEEMQRFYQFQPENIVHDLHLDYASSQYALTSTLPKRAIQHHHAHALSCMAENQLNAPVLAITWDGSGLGENNQLWGGEFFIFHQNEIEHYAQFLPFPLVGGEKATKEPRRIALAILEKIKIEYDLPFSPQEKNLLLSALAKNINCPKTSSVGRLFDAMASFLSVCQISSYEGQASMKVEMLALKSNSLEHYPFDIVNEKLLLIDWQSFFINIIKDIENAVSDAVIARKFHNTLAEIVLQIAFMANQKNIVLSGGCFQNALLTECVVEKLTAAQFCVYRHQNVPPNDQGLALGQLYEF